MLLMWQQLYLLSISQKKKLIITLTSIYNSFVIKSTLTIDNVRKISEPIARALEDLQEETHYQRALLWSPRASTKSIHNSGAK